ncbi:MAG TPA: glycosyltransferase family 1 protein [Ruminiclostridium sp.]|nr:glycosyltransferase family 1 protein [Ruminiclostridium sp.]
MISNLSVGIPIIGSSGWLGGVSHMELHVKAVTSLPQNERPRLFLLAYEHNLDNFTLYRSFVHLFDGVIYCGENIQEARVKIGQDVFLCPSQEELFEKIDFYFPVNYNVLPGRCAASWIHDFQHKYLPALFPTEDRLLREELCQKIADQSRLVFCSSKAVQQDFMRFYPESKAITRVLALRILPEEDWYGGDPLSVQQQYGLPDRFILCSNQFWAHKNHRTLFHALALLRQEGFVVHLVCTGATGDFRCPDYFGELQQYITKLGIADLVHILGLIPRHDQIQLIRRSLFVIQPSLFEGLSLIVEECRALGKPILLSDLEVHCEHEYGICFLRTDAADLAHKAAELLAVSKPGPDVGRELEAKMQAQSLVTRYAKDFCSLVEESQVIFNRNSRTSRQISDSAEQKNITIATSIKTLGNLAIQQKAVGSWLALGFRVIAVNFGSDIETMRRLFPGVEFYAAETVQALKERVCFNDIVSCLEKQGSEICGIVEPDVYLSGESFYPAVLKETVQGAVCGTRMELASLEWNTQDHFQRFGYIFFPCSLLQQYPKEDFYMGMPGWEIWALLMFLKMGIAIKHITAPVAYHIVTEEEYRTKDWLAWGKRMIQFAPAPFPLTSDTIDRYHQILFHIIHKHASEVKL